MEQTTKKSTMEKFINLKKVLAVKRARSIKNEADIYFRSQVHHCCGVSSNNHELAFIVERVGIFRGPKVQQISKPQTVSLSEMNNYVVVKDGHVYELTRRAE